MRSLLYVLSARGVIALAFWAYQENYRTQDSIKHVHQLSREIAAANSSLRMLRAEWAYLNRPDRLRDLVDLNFDRLGLLPLMPDGFGRVDQVIYPSLPLLPVSGRIVEVSSDGDAEGTL